MISKKALMIGLVGLVFVAGGTATVLESFGTVSGTADVRPALDISAVGNTSSDSEAYVKIDVLASEVPVSRVNISDSEEDAFDPLTGDEEVISSGSTVIVTGEEPSTDEVQGWFPGEDIVHFTSGDQAVGGGLDNRDDSGDTVRLNISGNTVDTFPYGGADQ